MKRLLIFSFSALLLVAAAWAIAAWQWPAQGADHYSVVDGDTLELTPGSCLLSKLGIACMVQRLRLYGVDAFESKQTCEDEQGKTWPCGEVATERLRYLVGSPGFSCHIDQEFRDRHTREFALCTSS